MTSLISRNDLRQIWYKSRQDLIFTQATALAYTSLLSFVPILAVGFSVFHAIGGVASFQARLQPMIEENLAPAFSAQTSKYIDDLVNNVHAGTIGVVGAVVFLFISVSALGTIEKTLNSVWGTRQQRGWARRVMTYWTFLTVGPLFFGASLALSSGALRWLRYGLSSVFFACLFLFMPNVYVNRRDALKAGILTGAVFEIAKVVYSFYAVIILAHNKVYGSLILIPTFLIWLYVAWLIVLFGAELSCLFQFRRLNIPFVFNFEDRLNPMIIVDLVEALDTGAPGPKGGHTLPKIIEALKLPMRQTTRHLDFLETEGWVASTRGSVFGAAKYFLTAPAEAVDFTKIFSKLESRGFIPTSRRAAEAHRRLQDLLAEWAKADSQRRTP